MNDRVIYRINRERLESLKLELAKLNKRAAKLGVQPIVLTETGITEAMPKTLHPVTRQPLTFSIFEICTLQGATPKYAGWTLAAVVEHAEEGNILRKAPGCTAELVKFRTGAPVCQHCNLERRRKDTYIVIHETGTQKQVGHNCIKDFLGHADPKQLAAWAELCYSASELCSAGEDYDGDGGYGRDTSIAVGAFLIYSALALRLKGWVSGKTAYESMDMKKSTKAWALQFMFPPKDAAGRIIPQPEPEQADEDRAAKARAFVLETLGTKDAETLSDFEHNVLTVCKCEYVQDRNVGMLAFIPEYFRKETEKALEREKKASLYKDLYFGEVKKRVKGVMLIYLGSSGWESQYGYTCLHRFVGPNGEPMIWKTGTEADWVEGQSFKATFTVKEHSDYKGRKQTIITRVVTEETSVQVAVAA